MKAFIIVSVALMLAGCVADNGVAQDPGGIDVASLDNLLAEIATLKGRVGELENRTDGIESRLGPERVDPVPFRFAPTSINLTSDGIVVVVEITAGSEDRPVGKDRWHANSLPLGEEEKPYHIVRPISVVGPAIILTETSGTVELMFAYPPEGYGHYESLGYNMGAYGIEVPFPGYS